MPDRARPPRLPKYRHYKPKDLGVVRIAGRDVYLGKYNSPESLEKYSRVCAEWLATGDAPAPSRAWGGPAAPPTVDAIILAFLTRHAEQHYRHADGTPTGELENFKDSLRPLRRLYGHSLARDFGPQKLKLLRESLIRANLSRGTINQRVGRIVHLFKWAASEELIPAAVHQGLKTLAGLQRGRSAARESEPVKPVPEAFVDAIEPHVARQVWAMIELQRLTGMRPGEVVIMRTMDLDTSGKVWVYSVEDHKNAHRGLSRKVYLGPKSQAILTSWLSADLTAYLFSPAEAVAERRVEMRQARASKVQPSQRDRGKARPLRVPRTRYTTSSYRLAIRRACARAGVPVWSPGRLRHNAATRLQKEFGWDTARAVLGHMNTSTTAIYVERDGDVAAAVMEQAG